MGIRLSPAGDRQSGYTLVELLVVLAVIGLLIAAAPAIVSTARPGTLAKAATFDLANELRAARVSAILTRAEITVALDLTNKTYVTIPGGQTRKLPAGYVLSFRSPLGEAADARAELRFFSDGSSSGGTIEIAGGGRKHFIVSRALTGRVSVDE